MKVASGEFDLGGVKYRHYHVANPTPEEVAVVSEVRSNQNLAVLMCLELAKDLRNAGIELPHFKQLAENTRLATIDADGKSSPVADEI